MTQSTDELERLIKAAQTDEPWTVVWYGDDSLPAIAIHRSTEDRICFMPTIQHPSDGVQFEANAALIVAAVNALPELVERVKRLEEALQTIRDRYIPDQPAAYDVSEADYTRKHYMELRMIARAALKETKP